VGGPSIGSVKLSVEDRQGLVTIAGVLMKVDEAGEDLRAIWKSFVSPDEEFGRRLLGDGIAAGVLFQKVSVVEMGGEMIGLLVGVVTERPGGVGKVVVEELKVSSLASDLEGRGVACEGRFVVFPCGGGVSLKLREDAPGIEEEIFFRSRRLGVSKASRERDDCEGEAVKKWGGHGPPLQ
jgi:hypothetical protein